MKTHVLPMLWRGIFTPVVNYLMSVDVIQLYLFFLSFHPLLFAYIWFVQWLTSYPGPMSSSALRSALFRDFLFFIVAGVGWILFVTDLLYWGVVIVTSTLDLAVFWFSRSLGITRAGWQKEMADGR